MSLKELIASDNNMFFNLDEFGEIHDIEGEKIICILDMENGSAGLSNFAEPSVSTNNYMLYAKVEDVPFEPCAGEKLRVDKKPYTVESCIESMGIYQIKLSRNIN